tara:strand:+ start:2040 stop:2549 length:510 start_codon:yes stop_codon:yes gene_type:complete
MSEVLLIEEAELREASETYEQIFIQDFQQEIHFLSKKHKLKDKDSDPQDFPKLPSELLKEAHRKLVKATHPDLNPNFKDDEFKEVQAAYERGDCTVLLALAARNNIEIELKEEDLQELEAQLQHRRQVLEQKKKAVRWVWCESDKSEKVRTQIRFVMGIDEKEYKEWLG